MKYLPLFGLAAILVPGLSADVVYDNTGATSDGVDCVATGLTCNTFSPSGNLYDSFTTGSAGELIDLELVLTGDNTSSGAVEAGLYADNATTPGTLISVLGDVNDSTLSSTPTIYDVTLTANPLLAADTRYWIGLSGTTTAGWSWSFDTSGVGVASEFFANPGGTFDNSLGPYQMSVSVNPSAVPEPSSALFVLAAIGAVALISRTRKLHVG